MELHQFFLPKRRRRPWAASCPVVMAACSDSAIVDEERRELAKGMSGLRGGLGDRDRDAFVDGAWDLSIARHEDVGLPSEHVRDIALTDSDLALRPVEHHPDRARIAPHQLEGLEAELRVLEREGVEHAHDDEIARRVDRRDHLGREPGRRVDDDAVERRPQRRVDVPDQLDRDRARLVGPRRREQGAEAGRMRHQVRGELLGVERATGEREVVERSVGAEPEAQGDIAELQVEVDDRDALPRLARARHRGWRSSGSCRSRLSARARR